MITVVHGDDIVSSRKHFVDLKNKAHEPVSLNGSSVIIPDLMQALEGTALFQDQKHIFIEELFGKKKTTARELKEITEYIAAHSDSASVVIWEPKQLTPATLKLIGSASAKLFKLPQSVFLFVDGLRPGNSSQLIELFRQTLINTEPELVFYMMVRQYRLLLALSDESIEPIDELKKIAPWQKQKLQKQTQVFDIQTLKKHYQKLLEIDQAQKTGTTPLSLTQAIDFFLLDL